MKRKMSLEDELDVTRTSVAELTGWCITIALHDLFGIGRERLNRVNNRQRMLAEQSMAIMMQPNERGMADITRLGEISLPKLSENMAPEDRRAINNYLMQLRDQTMYMLRNLDESNFSDAMRDKLTAMGCGQQDVPESH